MTPSAGRHRDWNRLEDLTKRLAGGGRARRPEELREFWRLYRGATARLAALQADGRADEEEWSLNRLVGAAHAALYRRGRERSLFRRLPGFLAREWPARVRAAGRAIAASACVFAAGGLVGAFYASHDPGFAGLVAPPDLLASVERGEMWTGDILTVKPAATSFLFSNNLSVAIAAFAAGITAGIGTLWILLMNGVLLGAVTQLTAARGMSADFWGFVAPHGVLEIPAILIAGAAGLTLGRGLLFPGALPRRRAVAAAAREGVALLAGCGPVLAAAAAVEAWFSPEPMALAVKLGVAGLLAAGLAAHVATPGRAGAGATPGSPSARAGTPPRRPRPAGPPASPPRARRTS
jgi:uncharacterized membrane protein SpoIIM required for sporulation